MRIILLSAITVAVATPALAKGGGKAMYHCMKADGTEDTAASNKKACKKAGGKWHKMKMNMEPATPPSK